MTLCYLHAYIHFYNTSMFVCKKKLTQPSISFGKSSFMCIYGEYMTYLRAMLKAMWMRQPVVFKIVVWKVFVKPIFRGGKVVGIFLNQNLRDLSHRISHRISLNSSNTADNNITLSYICKTILPILGWQIVMFFGIKIIHYTFFVKLVEHF